MNEQQSVSGVGAGSNGTDFQPPTQNPQSNVNSTVQTTDTGLQTASDGTNVLGTHTILVPTANGNVAIAPTSTSSLATTATVTKHPPVVAWLGAGLVVLLVAVMAIGLLRPRKYT